MMDSYCWWKKSCTTWDVQNPVNDGMFTISTGAGFQPSTVWLYQIRNAIIPWMVFIKSPLRCECHVGKSLRNVVVTNPGLDPWGEAFYKCVAWSRWMRCRSCCWCSCCGCGPVGDQQTDQPNSVIRLKLLSVIRESKEGVKGLALNGTNPVPPCFGTSFADPSNLLIAWERHKSS